MNTIIEHNAETGEIIEREMTATEIAELEQEQTQLEARNAEIKSAREALLNRLGITEEEARLLLG